MYEEVKSKTFKPGQVGDYIQGTLTNVSKTNAPDAYGKLAHIYNVKADEGTFLGSTKNEKTGKHVQDTESTVIKSGEEYTIFVSDDKGKVIGDMKTIAIGQKFQFKFTELKPTTKGNDAKIIKIAAGKTKEGKPLMDQEWLESRAATSTEDSAYGEF